MRKLRQLQERKAKKQKRTLLYDTLAQHAIQSQELELLHSSATLGAGYSKKETLSRIIKKQRAGIELTMDEEDVLYTKVEVDETENDCYEVSCSVRASVSVKQPLQNQKEEDDDEEQQGKSNYLTSQNKLVAQSTVDSVVVPVPSIDVEILKLHESRNNSSCIDNDDREKKLSVTEPVKPISSWSKSIMSSLASLKSKEKEKQSTAIINEKEEENAMEISLDGGTKYVPAPIDIRTAAQAGLVGNVGKPNENHHIIKVRRSPELQKLRYSLPVCEMEFDIIESIKENDVTIIAGETGSGKSTQIPQFCYEAGFTFGNKFTIGITQPRRVAAVSTAKRVAYELSCIKESDQFINSKSFVGYCTRYESAGLGSCNCIKFMTDGILLSEIQNDLLLRKYR